MAELEAWAIFAVVVYGVLAIATMISIDMSSSDESPVIGIAWPIYLAVELREYVEDKFPTEPKTTTRFEPRSLILLLWRIGMTAAVGWMLAKGWKR